MSESCPRKGTIISPLHCSSLSLREWTRNAFLSTAAFGGLPRHSLWTRRGKCVCQSSAKCQECQVPVRGKVQRPLSNIQRERERAPFLLVVVAASAAAAAEVAWKQYRISNVALNRQCLSYCQGAKHLLLGLPKAQALDLKVCYHPCEKEKTKYQQQRLN